MLDYMKDNTGSALLYLIDNQLALADYSPEVIKKAQELLQTQKSVGAVTNKFKNEKAELQPLLTNGPLELPEGVVTLTEGSQGLVLNRDMLKQLLMQEFKVSSEFVDNLFNRASLQKIVAQYNKIIPRKSIDNMRRALEENKNKAGEALKQSSNELPKPPTAPTAKPVTQEA